MTKNIETLLKGEKALENAPKAELADGRFCIPQHYLSYQHSLQSVEQLLLDIDFDPRYPLFASQDNSGIYVQVGIIGVDNYKSDYNNQEKIVYGRKWRVEPQLPTSEIIQTLFLALKKAREHEIRELLRFECNGKVTTPFNNHHDLPLLTNSRTRLQPHKLDYSNQAILFNNEIKDILKRISYGSAQFELMDYSSRATGQHLFELMIVKNPDEISTELEGTKFISLLIDKLDVNFFLHQLMQQLIQLSDRYVDEHFYYRGFNRFSWKNDVAAIAQLSSDVRQLHKTEDAKNFTLHWQQNNYETDQSRIPIVSSDELWRKLKNQFKAFSPIESTLPIRP